MAAARTLEARFERMSVNDENDPGDASKYGKKVGPAVHFPHNPHKTIGANGSVDCCYHITPQPGGKQTNPCQGRPPVPKRKHPHLAPLTTSHPEKEQPSVTHKKTSPVRSARPLLR